MLFQGIYANHASRAGSKQIYIKPTEDSKELSKMGYITVHPGVASIGSCVLHSTADVEVSYLNTFSSTGELLFVCMCQGY